MLELVLLRHPETQWNREQRIQGHTNIPALDTTVPEALVREILNLGYVAVVYTSTLKRCSAPVVGWKAG